MHVNVSGLHNILSKRYSRRGRTKIYLCCTLQYDTCMVGVVAWLMPHIWNIVLHSSKASVTLTSFLRSYFRGFRMRGYHLCAKGNRSFFLLLWTYIICTTFQGHDHVILALCHDMCLVDAWYLYVYIYADALLSTSNGLSDIDLFFGLIGYCCHVM